MDKTVKGSIKKYLNKYQANFTSLTLHEKVYKSDDSKLTLLELIPTNRNEEIKYSEKMKQALLSLNKNGLKLIMLIYNEGYDYEELATLLKVEASKIRKKKKSY